MKVIIAIFLITISTIAEATDKKGNYAIYGIGEKTNKKQRQPLFS